MQPLKPLMYIAVLLCLSAGLCGGEVSEPMNNEAVLEDAAKIWRDQSHDVHVPAHGQLYLGGVYVWHGRADRQYKPFHQWELKLRAGDQGAKAVRCKVIPLDARMEVQQLFRKKGTPWLKVGSIAAGEEKIVSYKLNCSHITSYRLLLEWDGGSQELFAGTRFMLPIDARALDKQPYLTVSDADFKYSKRRRRAIVSFWLTNVGGGPADDVKHTIEFLNETGKAIHSEVYVPEEGSIEAGYGKQQEVLFKKIPPFDNINIRTKQKQILTYQIDGDQLAANEDIGLSNLSVGKESVTGTITNGFKETVNQLLVTITFEDGAGEVVKELKVNVASLKPGASTDFEEAIEEGFVYKAYAMGYSMAVAE